MAKARYKIGCFPLVRCHFWYFSCPWSTTISH